MEREEVLIDELCRARRALDAERRRRVAAEDELARARAHAGQLDAVVLDLRRQLDAERARQATWEAEAVTSVTHALELRAELVAIVGGLASAMEDGDARRGAERWVTDRLAELEGLG